MNKKNEILCCECNDILIKDHIALSKKLIGRRVTRFYCVFYLAKYLECELSDLEVKIMEFKEQGCALFL